MPKFLVPALAALIIFTAACSDNKKPAAAPATAPPTTAAPVTSPPTTAATTTTLPEFLDAPRIQHICSDVYHFCVDMPTDLKQVAIPDHTSSSGIASTPGTYDVDRATGHVCPLDFDRLPQCAGFESQFFGADVEPMPGVSQADAIRKARDRFTPDAFDQVHEGNFLGSPAVFATFHTDTGGYGPYIDVWHNGVMYHLSANGLNGPADLAQQFLDSFRFTDGPPTQPNAPAKGGG